MTTHDAPTVCSYCDGHGNSTAGGACGFCDKGRPLDTQEDWDNSWGGLFKRLSTRDEYEKGIVAVWSPRSGAGSGE